ncbi:MAG: helix-turn-helix transcriptional regulator [Oscillospiraceae bacterium]|nr:helix-turn-helix transcriptional regulator [Oscillospiraceae bacterium]
MEFCEKLQELRKSKGLTQEELAEVLYVSRTAVSKWESGRGLPNIDSLKEISAYFSVSIDDLLSADKIIFIAEKEKKSCIKSICDLLFGLMDILSFLLIILPLYPKTVDSFVYSVNLFKYTETTSFNLSVYWTIFLSLTISGIVKLISDKLKIYKISKFITVCSVLINITAVLYLALSKEPYAVTVIFLILLIKFFLLFKISKTTGFI